MMDVYGDQQPGVNYSSGDEARGLDEQKEANDLSHYHSALFLTGEPGGCWPGS